MTAPIFRAVEQHTGEVAARPSKFWGALSEADQFCADLDTLRELQCRVQELTAEHDAWKRYATENASLRCRVDELEAELSVQFHRCDRLESKLMAANAQLKRMQATR